MGGGVVGGCGGGGFANASIRPLAAAAAPRGSPGVSVSGPLSRGACLQDSIASRRRSKRDVSRTGGASRWLFNPVQYVVIQNGAMTALSSSVVAFSFFSFSFFFFLALGESSLFHPPQFQDAFPEAAVVPVSFAPPSCDFSI